MTEGKCVHNWLGNVHKPEYFVIIVHPQIYGRSNGIEALCQCYLDEWLDYCDNHPEHEPLELIFLG